MFGEGGDPFWAAALPIDPRLPGHFPPPLSVSIPAAPYPDRHQGFAPPTTTAAAAAAAAPVPYPCGPEHLRGFAPAWGRTAWTKEENRTFEAALVEFHGASEEERCRGIAARLPGKTWEDVREHYQRLERDLRDIESGVIPLPDYAIDWFDSGAAAGSSGGGGGGAGRAKSEERKKGIPWTEEEHRRFLQGLEKYGKGDWRSISRMAVVTRTPTQVASHAQKYFLRQSTEAGKRDRRRSSIHDVTTT